MTTKVILKLDDLTSATQHVADKWHSVVDYMTIHNIKASFGALRAHENDEAATAPLRVKLASPLFEIFNHGYLHNENVPNPGDKEFSGPDFTHQLESMQNAQNSINGSWGVRPTTFGAPFNAVDATTGDVLRQIQEINLVMFGEENVLGQGWGWHERQRFVNMENPTLVPNLPFFIDSWNTAVRRYNMEPVVILQAHPTYSNDPTDFFACMDWLQTQDVEFILPREYYQSRAWVRDYDRAAISSNAKFANLPLRNSVYHNSVSLLPIPVTTQALHVLEFETYNTREQVGREIVVSTGSNRMGFSYGQGGRGLVFFNGNLSSYDSGFNSFPRGYNKIRLEYTAIDCKIYVNDEFYDSFITGADVLESANPFQVGARSDNWSPYVGALYSLRYNEHSVTLPTFGDANLRTDTGIVSTTSGNMRWAKQGYFQNFVTPSLFMTWLNATTLTAPLTVQVLEDGFDVSGIPAEKDGFSITVVLPRKSRSFGFDFSFNF